MRLVIGISGSTGAIYGVRMLEVLHGHPDLETHAVVSDAAKRTIEYETGRTVADVLSLATVVYDHRDVGAAISSGSYPVAGMIVAPCSIKTLSSVANSYNDNLLSRAADVQLKERRRLVLLPREAPLHLGHLRNLCTVVELGAIILPPVPAFYHRPRSMAEAVDHIASKAIDLVGLPVPAQTPEWQG